MTHLARFLPFLLLASPIAAQTPPREALAALAARVDPTAIEETLRGLVACHNRNTYGESEEGERGVGAARRFLVARLRAYAARDPERVRVEEQWFDLPLPRRASERPEGLGTRGANVIVTIRGDREPERTFVVGGHYDSRATGRYDVSSFAPGASDDASGTAVVVELARILSSPDVRLGATVQLACYTGEEQGLLGSTHHLQALQEARVELAAMITNDIVGNTLGDNGVRDRETLRIFSEAEDGLDSPSRQWARFAAEMIAAVVPELTPKLVYRLDRAGRGGDHAPFHRAGIAALRFTEPNEAYTRQHQDVRREGDVAYGDVLEMVDVGYVARVVKANLVTIASAARAPRAPERAVIRRSADGTRTEVAWRPSPSAEVSGYEIVWRETSAAQWEGGEVVGPEETRATIDRSLDDWFFGVRAVGPEGFRGPLTFAGMGRGR